MATTGSAARRGSRTSSRREQILHIAADLFAERGYHGVSIDDLGAAVGISGPGLYRHFPGKDAVLGEMLVGISERLLAEGQRRLATVDDDAGALEQLIAWHVEFALDNPALITVQERDLSSLADADRTRVRRLQRRYVELWVDTIQRLVPGTEEHAARAAAHAVFGLINSTPHSARIGRASMAHLLERMAMAALTSPGVLTPASEPATAAADRNSGTRHPNSSTKRPPQP
jgi:AcrR family transcriptional regulator